MSKRIPACLLLVLFAFAILNAQEPNHHRQQPTITPQNSGTTNLLVSVSPVDSRVVWASGANGTFLVTTDGGNHWRSGVVPGAETLQFRDVQGVSSRVAYLMSIGDNPTDFRIYKTSDGGAHWTMQFQNQLTGAFYDCFAFWTPQRGIAHSDSVNGVFPDLRTTDGVHWQSIANNMPPALTGEASFSSSGTCVATQGGRNAWIGTGGATTARILATRDGGNTWNAYDTPLVSNPTAGVFTVAFRTPWNGILGGGDLDPNDPNNARTAISRDGGRTWTLTNAPPVIGAIFGLAYLQNTTGVGDQHDGHDLDGRDDGRDGDHDGDWGGGNTDRTVVITADTGGAAWTPDEGNTWFPLNGVSGLWCVAFADPHDGWMVGRNGQILKISFR
jgi:photosystem II stability/assembly factor-like uncharacterized protein